MFEPVIETNVEAVGEKVAAAKPLRVCNQLLDFESHGGVVRADHRACADADDRIDWNAVAHQLSKHADVSGAAQTAGTEHDTDANPFIRAD